MARLFKPVYPKRRTVTGPDGKSVREIVREKRLVTRGKDKGTFKLLPVYEESPRWRIEYRDAAGRRRTAPGYTDKVMSQQKAAKLELAVMQRIEGITTADPEHLTTSIEKHAQAWVEDLHRTGRSEGYIVKVEARVAAMREALGWSTASSIQADRFTTWLATKARGGASSQTCNHYRDAAIAFLNWCVEQGRLPANPLLRVRKSEVVEPSIRRRAATVAELRALVITAPPARSLVYLAAGLTGLRRSELAALRWSEVLLDAARPYIALRASAQKSRRADLIPVNDELAEALRQARPTTCHPEASVFRSIPKSSTVKADVEAAGIEFDTEAGKLDLHALRMTYNALIELSGIDLRDAQQLMRHSDIRLTAKTYRDPRLTDKHASVQRLPRIAAPPAEAVKATGTYDPGPSGLMLGLCSSVTGHGRTCKKTRVRESKAEQRGSIVSDAQAEGCATKKVWRRGESNSVSADFVSCLIIRSSIITTGGYAAYVPDLIRPL